MKKIFSILYLISTFSLILILTACKSEEIDFCEAFPQDETCIIDDTIDNEDETDTNNTSEDNSDNCDENSCTEIFTCATFNADCPYIIETTDENITDVFYHSLIDAQSQLQNINDNNAKVTYNDKIVAMKYGIINFNTKYSSQITILGRKDFSIPTYINGSYNVDALYLYSEGVFTYGVMAGLWFEVPTSEVELIPINEAENGFSYYYVIDNELYHYISMDIKNDSFVSIGPMDIAPSYLEPNIRYYSYNGHYFYTDFYLMVNDYQNKNFSNAVNKDNPYYNYYQFLSFRSQTMYSAEELNNYLTRTVSPYSALYNSGSQFINAADNVYINAALELSFAIHESGYGTSNIARDKNNLFGINATDDNPYENALTFDSVEDCIVYHVEEFLQLKYFNPYYYTSFGAFLGDKSMGMNYKYASDAYWGEKIASHYYRLDKALGFKDRNHYRIGFFVYDLIGTYGPLDNSPIIYDASKYNYYGLSIPFIIERETDTHYVLRLPIGINIDTLKLDPYTTFNITDVFYVTKEQLMWEVNK